VDENDQEVPVGEVGEFCVKGPNVMIGYQNQPKKRQKRSGTAGSYRRPRQSEKTVSFIWLTAKRICDGLGQKVYPRVVEDCLYTHPKVMKLQLWQA
jgi:long-chain acyl-CoA synthetase